MPLSAALRTSKNTLMLFTGTMLRMVASFAFVLFAAKRLGVEGFGRYSLAIFYFELTLSLAATAVGILFTRDAARWPKQANKLITSSMCTVAVLSVGAAAITLLLSQVFGYSGEAKLAIALTMIALLPSAGCVVFEAAFVTKERAEFVTAGTAIESLLRLGASFFLLWQGFGVASLMVVLIFVRVVLVLLYAVNLSRLDSLRWDFSARRTARFLSRWRIFAAENWMATIYTSLDVLILSAAVGEVAVGLYSAAWKVVRLGSVLAKSYTTAIFPVMSRMYGDGSRFNTLYRESIRVMCLIALPAAVMILVLADRIIGWLFESEFAGAIPILQVLVWVLLIEFLNPFLSHALFAQGKQQHSMYAAGISLAFNLIATLALVFKFGAVGAAWGTVLSGLVATCCYLKFLMPRQEIAGTLWTTFRIAVASIGFGFILFWLREMPLPLMGIVSAAGYLVLLFAVRGIRVADVEMVRSVISARTAS